MTAEEKLFETACNALHLAVDASDIAEDIRSKGRAAIAAAVAEQRTRILTRIQNVVDVCTARKLARFSESGQDSPLEDLVIKTLREIAAAIEAQEGGFDGIKKDG